MLAKWAGILGGLDVPTVKEARRWAKAELELQGEFRAAAEAALASAIKAGAGPAVVQELGARYETARRQYNEAFAGNIELGTLGKLLAAGWVAGGTPEVFAEEREDFEATMAWWQRSADRRGKGKGGVSPTVRRGAESARAKGEARGPLKPPPERRAW